MRTPRVLAAPRCSDVLPPAWQPGTDRRTRRPRSETVAAPRCRHPRAPGGTRNLQWPPPAVASPAPVRQRARHAAYALSTMDGNPSGAVPFREEKGEVASRARELRVDGQSLLVVGDGGVRLTTRGEERSVVVVHFGEVRPDVQC